MAIRLPVGVEDFYIRELESDGWEWVGIRINNPYPTVQNVGLSEYTIKTRIDEVDNGIVGIYEQIGDQKYKLGCILDNDTYKLVYLGSGESYKHWRVGDVKAILRETATPGLFKADWRMLDKTLDADTYVTFDGSSMKTVTYTDSGAKNDTYVKMYPTGSSSGINTSKSSDWSGSGFALKDGYIVTNYHVIDGAKSITIKGIKGDFSISYVASVAASDKYNDLALLRINDNRFSGFDTIPYSVKTTTAEVGEDVFVLGYPLTTTMGDEIKYTTGVISSKTGFQGDVSLYQISAPIQPGNSGGPLFDAKGTLIGVVNAKHQGAENVGYAVKASYLRNLIESFSSTAILPTSNTISSLSRPEQIKAIKKFVFLIECSSSGTDDSTSYSSSTTSGSSSSSHSQSNSSIFNGVKTVYYPKNGTVGNTTITKVEVSATFTKVYMHYVNNYASGGWCSISPETYIVGPSGDEKKLIKAINIPKSPNKHVFARKGETLDFVLEFPALTYGTAIKYFKLVEPGGSSWVFNDIRLD